MDETEQKLVETLRGIFFRAASNDPDDFLPETLYHYTSAAGLFGIISTGKLWGSHYNYLNDASELAYGREVALQVVREKLEANSTEPGRSCLETVLGRLAAEAKVIDFYLTCFCQNPDLLSQWRGYGTASGRFCLGFNVSGFNFGPRWRDEWNTKYSLGPVIYDEVKQQRKVTWAIDTAIETLTKGRANNTPFRDAITGDLIRKLLQELCFFKDKGFKEEDEWRMVHFARDASSVHFPPSTGLLKPVIDMITATTSPPVLPITEIIVGSSSAGPLAKKSATLLLERYNYNGVEVRETSRPFRELSSASSERWKSA